MTETPAPADRVALALFEIKARGYRNGASGALAGRLSDCADIDVPRLVAALEAVLREHQPEPGVLPPMCSVCQTEWDDSRDDWPCKTWQAISRGLLGEDGA